MNNIRHTLRLAVAAVMTCVVQTALAQVKVEYFIDDDPGFGKGKTVTTSVGANGEIDFDVSTLSLTAGSHTIGIRSYSTTEDGTTAFSPTIIQEFRATKKINLQCVEYFWDTDPGYNQGTQIAIPEGAGLEYIANLGIPTTGLTKGPHKLGIRIYGDQGWSPTTVSDVNVHTTESAPLQCIEYFWDTDPGFNAGTQIAIPASTGLEYINNLDIPTTGLSVGPHALGIRICGDQGWSPTIVNVVNVTSSESTRLQCIEYFWDTDPGTGKGTLAAIPASAGQTYETSFDIPTDGVAAGLHKLGIRTYGGFGWSPTMVSEVMVKRTGEGAVINYAEYFWNEDPGFGKGTPIAIAKGMEVSVENLEIPSYLVGGACNLFFRMYGDQGWSPTAAFPVTVCCEGNYTLDSTRETSAEGRNFQTMADAMHDFNTRGISDNLIFHVTTAETIYPLDLTAEGMMEQVTTIADNMEQISTARANKTLLFRADDGKEGNIIDITVAPDNLKDALRLFAHSQVENVVLRINGTVYDFAAIAQRFQETCGETFVHDATGIAEGIQMTWTAQTNSKITGYVAEGTGVMPVMTLTNTGTALDSLTYTVTLSDSDGVELYTYKYNMYVHVLVSTKSFSGLTPKNGSALDPVPTTLMWNAVAGATKGYSLRITERPYDSDEEPKVKNVEQTANSYILDVKSGYHYTWAVTALGECDQLTSTEMSLDGRLLPDLQVAEITAPEYVEGGNQLTVKARIVNNGPGETTEKTWTDRLYYTLNDVDFAQAMKVKDIGHSGNLNPDGSYEVTFTVTAPETENGSLYFFVETDVTGKVMELTEDNNRQLSDEIIVNPFFVNESDFAALSKFYADYDGDNWSGSKWDFSNALIKRSNWSGITFDTEGNVTALNLQSRGLKGTMTAENGLVLPHLTTLNVSHNALNGDISMLVKECPALTTLNAAYNQIDALSTPLSSTVAVNLQYQDIDMTIDLDYDKLQDYESILVQAPSLPYYDFSTNSYIPNGFALMASVQKPTDKSGKNWSMNVDYSTGSPVFTVPSGMDNAYYGSSGDTLYIIYPLASDVVRGSFYRSRFFFSLGDANFIDGVDATDLQSTILYAFDQYRTHPFNYTAADTYKDGNINVQDVICTVNILLESEPDTYQSRLSKSKLAKGMGDMANTDAYIYMNDGKLILHSNVPVASLSIKTSGDIRWNVDTHGLQQSTSNGNVVGYSLNGVTLPNDEDVVLGEYTQVTVYSVSLSDVDAQPISVVFRDANTTDIKGASESEENMEIFNVSGYRTKDVRKGINIIHRGGSAKKIFKQ